MKDRPLVDQVGIAFADDGPLGTALEGFEARQGQRDLARAVADLFTNGGKLVAEAGTGTGKTLAYLVPSILARRRVLISTGTRTLQDQIVYKDVPALGRALGIQIHVACMKGRTNYLCRHRFDRLNDAAGGLSDGERAWLERIGKWLHETETGDRVEIDDLPDELPLWSELSATPEQCLGRDCPQYEGCFVTKMRERAAEADLVIVNHHLLCADAAVRRGGFGAVIPECDLAVVDEAHQLEDVITQYFGITLSTWRLEDLARDGLRGSARAAPSDESLTAALARGMQEILVSGRRLFDAVWRLVTPRDGRSGTDRSALTPEDLEALAPAGEALAAACGRYRALIERAGSVPPDAASLAARALALARDLERLVISDAPGFVRFVETRGRGVLLRAAPIDVAPFVEEVVSADRWATVLTSATLTVDRSFAYTLSRLGLERAQTLRVPSEFDYRTQAVLFLPRGLPDPRSPGFNRAVAATVAELLDRTRGRAFVLFTSHAALREVHAALAGRVKWPLLTQGTAPRTALLREFRATPHAVLLATSSFWQGVDVAGEALSCVVVDRLPFASPADPLMAARLAALEAAGHHPFHEYQVPLATLALLQGLGRLIRTRRDRGVLAILDPRLTTMGYGRRFLASLPPAPMTDDLEAIERFLKGEVPAWRETPSSRDSGRQCKL